jgi:hypothetical protein
MATKIIFSSNVNSSLQKGDIVYWCAISGNGVVGKPQMLGSDGTVKEVRDNIVIVEGNYNGPSTAYFCFSKNLGVNKSGLKGYYADISLINNSPKKAELFAISSEIVPSSK